MKKKIVVVLWLDVLVMLLTFLAVPITDWMLQNGTTCFFLKRGIICPACGGTHCVNNFFQGNIKNAFSYNPAVVIGVIYVFGLVLLLNLEVFWNNIILKKTRQLATHPLVLTICCVIYIVAGFMRNFYNN